MEIATEFDIRIPTNEILSTRPLIFLRIEYKCPCYEHRPPQIAEYIQVHRGVNHLIMISDAVKAMADHGISPDCKHYFLDGFKQTTEVQYTVEFGS
jgi:hypothetical protein